MGRRVSGKTRRARCRSLNNVRSQNRGITGIPVVSADAPVTITGPGPRKNKRSARGTGLWADSPYYSTAATVDRRWDNTVSTHGM